MTDPHSDLDGTLQALAATVAVLAAGNRQVHLSVTTLDKRRIVITTEAPYEQDDF